MLGAGLFFEGLITAPVMWYSLSGSLSLSNVKLDLGTFVGIAFCGSLTKVRCHIATNRSHALPLYSEAIISMVEKRKK